MKKLLSIVLALLMLVSCFALAACGDANDEGKDTGAADTGAADTNDEVSVDPDFKLGVIQLYERRSRG